VVEVPVAEHDREALDALGVQRRADRARVGDRDVGVVDECLRAVDDREAGDPQRERALVDPVRLRGVAIAGNAAVVEREDARRRAQDPQMVDRRSLSQSRGW